MERVRNRSFWTGELSGCLGDLGTFLPLVVALAATIQLDLGTTLLVSGVYNILTGVTFRIPMCVQPMKTIAALALTAPGLSLPEVAAAGLFVAVACLVLGVSSAMDAFSALIPAGIVRGIQLAVGLTLAQKGIFQALMSAPHSFRAWLGLDGLLLGLLGLAFLLVTTMPPPAAAKPGLAARDHQHDAEPRESEQQRHHHHHQQQQQQQHHHHQHPAADDAAGSCSSGNGASGVPSALLVVLVGVVLIPIAAPDALSGLRFGPSVPSIVMPTLSDWQVGIRAGLAQLPLTGLNSVLAVSALAHELFPERVAELGWRWRPGSVAVCLGAMNLVGCWLGAFPCCTGAGGLAAQYKFGARSGAAPVILGTIKILLALVFGSSLLPLLQRFPQPLLGGMLAASGLELASSARKQTDGARGFTLMLLTAAAIVALGDTALGFLAGLAAAILAEVHDYCFHGALLQRLRRCWAAAGSGRGSRRRRSGGEYTPCPGGTC